MSDSRDDRAEFERFKNEPAIEAQVRAHLRAMGLKPQG